MDKFNKPDKLGKPAEVPISKDHLAAMRFRNSGMFTEGGDAVYSNSTDNKDGSAPERPKDISNPYKIAFLGASPDASADPNTSIFMDQQQRLEKIEIERDGNLWKVTDGNGNIFCAEEVVLGPEARGIEKNVSFGEMLKLKIVGSKTFIQAHHGLDELAKAELKKVIKEVRPRIIFSGEKGAQGANFLAQGEGYGVTLTGIPENEEKRLYRYMPYSLAKMAATENLKLLKQPSEKDRVTFRDSINQLDPTFRVEAAEHMSAEEEAKNKIAREFLGKYIHPDVIADLEKGPIDLAYGLPPGGRVYNSSVKSAEIIIEDGDVKVTLCDGNVIEGKMLVLGKENSAVSILKKQDLEDLVPYRRGRNVVGVQTRDGSMKILDTTPDPRLSPDVNEILYKANRQQELAREVIKAKL